MVRKETCPDCRGNRYVKIVRKNGESAHRKCPSCDGTGFRIRISLDR
jgi:DnaJ-class molecular chaperone